MRPSSVSNAALFVKAQATCAVMLAVVMGGSAAAAELNWQSPVIRQTAGYQQNVPASPRQRSASRPGSSRIAMNDGEVIMDGSMMMLDGEPSFGGSAGMSGGMMSEPCTTCRTPPWHGSVAPPACYGPGQCGPICDPCQPCDPCDRPYRQSCFPRLQALFGEGYLASPLPPCEPRCRHCGMPVPVGF